MFPIRGFQWNILNYSIYFRFLRREDIRRSGYMNGPEVSKPLGKQELLAQLRRLEQVSKDIEKTGSSLRIVQNLLQHAQLKDKMDTLSREQAAIVKKIVDTSRDIISKNEFLHLSSTIDEFQSQIKSCKSSAELNELQKKIDSTVERWVELFQHIAFDAIKSSQ